MQLSASFKEQKLKAKPNWDFWKFTSILYDTGELAENTRKQAKYAVKDLLGHRSIMNTDRYQHGSYANDILLNDLKQAKKDDLISTGFEYVRFDDREQVPIYREKK